MMRKFEVEVAQVVIVEFDDTLRPEGIMPDEEWRAQMYNIQTPAELAEHLAYNYVANGIDRLSMLDGFADRQDDEVEYSAPFGPEISYTREL